MLSVLIVDDDRLVRAKVKSMLQNQGFLVETTDEWSEISRIVGTQRIDVILMDVLMPFLEGDKIAQVLLKRMQNPPRILLHSSLSSKELSDKVRDVGAHGFVRKGLTPEEYAARIRQAVDEASPA